MENSNLSLAHLETLSSADLISLADSYGIDIPENLNRRFIIGELLEVFEEQNQHVTQPEIKIVNSEEEEIIFSEEGELPKSFNETKISVILRNPAWAFVFWDISEAALNQISNSSKFKKLVLRVLYFENEGDTNPVKYFDMDIPLTDREQYILLDGAQKFFRVDLVAFFTDGSTDNLTISEKKRILKTPTIFQKSFPGIEFELPKILELSGLKKILKAHYEKYRESFSN